MKTYMKVNYNVIIARVNYDNLVIVNYENVI